MLRSVLARLAARVRCDAADDDEDGEDARFVPSVLDASVRYAHGMSRTGVEGEIADVEAQAERIEAETQHPESRRRDE